MDALGIDIGTTNVKAVLVRDDGTTLAAAHRPLAWDRRGDAAEQDAEALWQAVLDALGDLAVAAGSGAMADVAVMGLCGQYSSTVPVGADARPLAPMRLYLDQRGTGHCRDILRSHDDAFTTWLDRHPIPPVGGGLALGHLLAFQLDEPGVHEAAAAYLEAVDYLAARLTGVVAATQGSMFASQLIDNRTLGVTAYDLDLVTMAGVDERRLPPLVAVGSVVGVVQPEVAGSLGLRAGVPVLTGMTDSSAQSVATGADRAGRVGVVIGTTGVVLSSAAALGIDPEHDVLAMPGLRTDCYLVSAENGIAGRAVAHVLDRFVHADDALGAHGTSDPFAGFEGALAATPAGARGVRFLPWLSGSLAPHADPTVRGGFVGVSLDTERVDLVRAAAEGVAHNLRWLLGPVESFTGQATDEVVLTGGAARSPGWSQIVADVLQLPVRTVAEPGHSGARAAAGWALDQLAPGVAADWVELDRTHAPDPSVAARHDDAQSQFTAAFEALRPLSLGTPPPS